MINTELLQSSLDYLDTHPEEHDQKWWGARTECGTTFCLAGYVCVSNGIELTYTAGSATSGHRTADGRLVFEVARALLGLSSTQADRLFFCCITIENLWDAAEEITDGVVHRRSPIEHDNTTDRELVNA